MIKEERQVKLVVEAIKDYKFISMLLNCKLLQIKDVRNIEETFKELRDILDRVKGTDITNYEVDGEYAYLDFLYNNVNMSVYVDDGIIKVGRTFEIWDTKNDEYIVDDFMTMEAYEELITKYYKEKDLERIKGAILSEMQEEFVNKVNDIHLDTIDKYKDKYNIGWDISDMPYVRYELFEEII